MKDENLFPRKDGKAPKAVRTWLGDLPQGELFSEDPDEQKRDKLAAGQWRWYTIPPHSYCGRAAGEYGRIILKQSFI
jgi:hypothetical protein